jgi:hypothetical protein
MKGAIILCLHVKAIPPFCPPFTPGNQPGDPAKAANLILKVAALDEPPLRLLLESDAVRIVEQADLARLETDKKWRDLSVSTEFDDGSAAR